ncbi:MAG: SDR family oxidoreductase [Sphingomonadaceae bacterium]|uniref:SDR family NAD(P)-dependent oxidoreductase n=1 Tax=Thermaurantiacus sp. TaxID=2820283 RepID=UPI00298F15A6|nr:SDR family NAD(P)-dependent oxidoreductase [Thermaurantiacus sp.]MCS6987710.1 SDR family oxidoreductase [Sphingomonadaceae bacterium]MDW8415071.1 SDR family NAD(P)-dependent oxidoreductase [Thermaurantiacus sp.]
MDLGLKDRRVILTGGSRGIGRATLELFAAEGAHLAFFSRRAEQVAETVQALAAKGVKVFGEPFDFTDTAAYRAWLDRAVAALGGCDIFVHNVSSSGMGATQDWEKTFLLDIRGAVDGIEVLTPHLAASGAGSVVFLSSTAAVETFIMPQAFNALKAALITYAKQLAQALGPKGIRVNVVTPGPIKFPGGNWSMIEQAMPDFYKATEAGFALGRFGTPEDVARAIVFLASPAAGYVTGTNLVVDGGFTKRVQF